MSVFVIADTHLSGKVNKSMEVFGSRWSGYQEKLCRNWRAIVNPEDTVILPGDISWGMNFDEALCDLKWLNDLPGQKYLGKGNHDFWWNTASKMNTLFSENHFDTLHILYNNAHVVEDFIVCGTRGWFNDEKQQVTVGDVDYQKIVNREAIRLKMSLDEAEKLHQMPEHAHREVLVFLHFPPAFNGFECRELLDLLKAYHIKRCFFGHIHGSYRIPRSIVFEDMTFTLVSSDYLNFVPMIIFPDGDE